jgi:DNA polymerase (family 10)
MRRTNGDVAAFLRRIADLHDVLEDNPFKARAYRSASDAVDDLAEPIATLAAEGVEALRELPAIGKSISTQISEFLLTGTSPAYELLVEEIPASATNLLALHGVGIRTARKFFHEFGILGVEDLVRFAEGGGLEIVEGLPERVASRIVASATQYEQSRARLLYDDAIRIALAMAAEIGALVGVDAPTPVGEIRRGRSVVHSIDLLAFGDAGSAATIASYPDAWGADEILVAIPTRIECATESGLPVRVHVANVDDRGSALVATTGNERHVRELRERATARGYAFRGTSLFDTSPGASALPLATEEAFYDLLGLRFIPPELREGSGEIDEYASA